MSTLAQTEELGWQTLGGQLWNAVSCLIKNVFFDAAVYKDAKGGHGGHYSEKTPHLHALPTVNTLAQGFFVC